MTVYDGCPLCSCTNCCMACIVSESNQLSLQMIVRYAIWKALTVTQWKLQRNVSSFVSIKCGPSSEIFHTRVMKVLLTTSMQVKSVLLLLLLLLLLLYRIHSGLISDRSFVDHGRYSNSVGLLQSITISGTTEGKLLSERHPKDFMFSFLDYE